MDNTDTTSKPTRPLSHRVLAWIVIALLLGMYIFTLVVAITQKGDVTGLFMACIGATIVLPGVLWIYMRIWTNSVSRTRASWEAISDEKIQRDEAVQGDEGKERDEADA